jgi:NADPH-dependent 2,4-dienoyl-CoA reductase/sulfur reductase-like enzyme
MTADQTFIVVGASLAGAKAAETLRTEGFDGRVLLIGAENERPYERPPLSKEHLRGEAGDEKVYLQTRASTPTTTSSFASAAGGRSGPVRPRADAGRWRAAALRPAAADHRGRASAARDSGRRARRGPVPTDNPGLRSAA